MSSKHVQTKPNQAHMHAHDTPPWTQKSTLYLSSVSIVVAYGAASMTSSTHLQARTILYLMTMIIMIVKVYDSRDAPLLFVHNRRALVLEDLRYTYGMNTYEVTSSDRNNTNKPSV